MKNNPNLLLRAARRNRNETFKIAVYQLGVSCIAATFEEVEMQI